MSTAPADPKPKRPLSEAELAARRANAQKSTGPRTEPGKAASRRNALKHGLAGSGACLVADDRAALEGRLADWDDDLSPCGATERWLVREAATASVKVDRIHREDQAALADRRRNADRDWDDARARQVRHWADRLGAQPAEAVGQLRRSAAGCDWLIAEWRRLGRILDQTGDWDDARREHAARLLGHAGPIRYHDEPTVAALGLHGVAARRHLDELPIDWHFECPDSEFVPAAVRGRRLHLGHQARKALPTAEQGRAGLAALVADQIAELEALREAVRVAYDAPERAEAAERAFGDPSPEGRLRQRYLSENRRVVFRTLALLEKGRARGRLWIGLEHAPETAAEPAVAKPDEPDALEPSRDEPGDPPASERPEATDPAPRNEPGAPARPDADRPGSAVLVGPIGLADGSGPVLVSPWSDQGGPIGVVA